MYFGRSSFLTSFFHFQELGSDSDVYQKSALKTTLSAALSYLEGWRSAVMNSLLG